MSFIMVDTVLNTSPQYIETRKLLSIAEEVYEIHFPHYPVLPAVLLIENIKQSIDILFQKENERKDTITYIDEVKKLKIYRSVQPGGILDTKVSLEKNENERFYFKAIIYESQQIVAKCNVVIMTKRREN